MGIKDPVVLWFTDNFMGIKDPVVLWFTDVKLSNN